MQWAYDLNQLECDFSERAETLPADVPTIPITFQPPAPTQVLRAYFEPHICLDELTSHLAARMVLPLAHVQVVLSSKPRSPRSLPFCSR